MVLAAQSQNSRPSRFQNAEQLVRNFRFAPKKALQILHPLEITDHHAASVAEDIRDNEYLRALTQNFISLGRDRTVRSLGQNATLNFAGIGGSFNYSAQDHAGLGTDAFVLVEIKNKDWVIVK